MSNSSLERERDRRRCERTPRGHLQKRAILFRIGIIVFLVGAVEQPSVALLIQRATKPTSMTNIRLELRFT